MDGSKSNLPSVTFSRVLITARKRLEHVVLARSTSTSNHSESNIDKTVKVYPDNDND